MKILRNIRRAFSFIGFLSDEKIFGIKTVHTIVTLLFFPTLILFEVSSVVYVVRQIQIGDYQNALYASLQVAAVLPAIVSAITMMYQKDKVRDVIVGLQKIFEQCNEPNFFNSQANHNEITYSIWIASNESAGELKSSAVHFIQADQLAEKFLSLGMIGVMGGLFASSFTFAAMGCAYFYKRDGHIEFRNIYVPFKIR